MDGVFAGTKGTSTTKLFSVTTQNDTLRIAVLGRFDMSLCFDLWYTCQLGQGRFRTYLFDLGKVDDMRDSGIAWLMMFSRKAAKTGGRICLINCEHDIVERCLAAGLNVKPMMPRSAIAAGSFAAVQKRFSRVVQ
jgi:anti-anti-sigma regulatory factor